MLLESSLYQMTLFIGSGRLHERRKHSLEKPVGECCDRFPEPEIGEPRYHGEFLIGRGIHESSGKSALNRGIPESRQCVLGVSV